MTVVVVKSTDDIQVIQRIAKDRKQKESFLEQIVGGPYEKVPIDNKKLHTQGLVGLIAEDQKQHNLSINRTAGFLTGRRFLFGNIVVLVEDDNELLGLELMAACRLADKIKHMRRLK